MTFRIADDADVTAVTTTIALAFARDPVWGPALAKADGTSAHLESFWRFFVEGAIGHSMILVAEPADTIEGGTEPATPTAAARSDVATAVAVWLPPGVPEMTPDQESEFERFLAAEFEAAKVAALTELGRRFEDGHPAEPHAYLSLLATHPDHRGRGIGQHLLAENLAELDSRGLPAYLESTNPDNDHRYRRAGFERIGGFSSVVGDAPITRMWRPVRH
jgi:ribosomal protein S18 acetylase RimI-like enzyme